MLRTLARHGFALAAGASVSLTFSAPAAPADITEHRTGHRFLLSRGATPAAHLLGANPRCMLGWCRVAAARAYAFGLYADADALARFEAAAAEAAAGAG